MANPPLGPATGDNAGEGPDRGSTANYPGAPRWVKVFGIVALVLLLLVLVIVATGLGGSHGPRRHTPSDAGGHTPLSSVTVHRVQQR